MAVINHADRLKVGTTEVWRAYKDSGIVYDLVTAISFPGINGNYDSTPDDPSFHITGPLSIIMHKIGDIPAQLQEIMCRRSPSADVAWEFRVHTNGQIMFRWQDAGSGTTRTVQAGDISWFDGWPWAAGTFEPTVDGGCLQTWGSNDGAGWSMLTSVAAGGADAVIDHVSGIPLTIGDREGGGFPLDADLVSIELRDGVGLGGEPGGSTVAIRDYSKPVTPYMDALGNAWTLNGDDWQWINTATGQPLD